MQWGISTEDGDNMVPGKEGPGYAEIIERGIHYNSRLKAWIYLCNGIVLEQDLVI